MSLSESQIERYSRQIIVRGVGGRAQQRLLASRLLLVADGIDLEMPLAYMVGAGVGSISVHASGGRAGRDKLARGMRDLNPQVRLRFDEAVSPDADLALVLVGSDAVLESIKAFGANMPRAVVLARLDSPLALAVLPAPPPCPACANGDLLKPVGTASPLAGFVAMLATAEAFKLLAGYEPRPSPLLTTFDGYKASAQPATARSDRACTCASRF